MPTLPLCGPCGPQWSISSIKHKEGSIYTVVFHGANVSQILWDVEQGCKDVESGSLVPMSSLFEINLGAVTNDGKAYFKAQCPTCEGYCNPFEFDIVHNNKQENKPSTPTNLTAEGTNSSTIRIGWAYEGNMPDNFELEYSVNGVDFAPVEGGLYTNGERVHDTGPWVSNFDYYFRIRAIIGDYASAWSSVVVGKALACDDVLSSAEMDEINAIIDGNISGYNNKVAAVVFRTNILFSRYITYADDTRVALASLSKFFAASVIMKVVEEGALSLNTTAGSLIPAMQANGKGNITLAQLMSHTSGLKANSDQAYESQTGSTIEDVVNQIAVNVPLLHTPGTRYEYGGVHWAVAARMAEIASSQSWITLCQTRILQPLGMNNTGYTMPPFPDPTSPVIHAGLVTTAADWTKFMRMWLKKGVYNNTRILSQAAIETMEADQTGAATEMLGSLEMKTRYGFGLDIDTDNNEVSHTSATGCIMWLSRRKNFFGFVFTEAYNGTSRTANNQLREKFRETLNEEGNCNPPAVQNADFIFLTNTTGYFDSDDFLWKIRGLSAACTEIRWCVRWDEYETDPGVYATHKLANRMAQIDAIYASKGLQKPRYCIDFWGVRHDGKVEQFIPVDDVVVFQGGKRATGKFEDRVYGLGSFSSTAYRNRVNGCAYSIVNWFNQNAPGRLNYMSLSCGQTEEFFNYLWDDPDRPNNYESHGDFSPTAVAAWRKYLSDTYGSITPWGESSASSNIPFASWDADGVWGVAYMVATQKGTAWSKFTNLEMEKVVIGFRNAAKSANSNVRVIHFVADFFRAQSNGWYGNSPSNYPIISQLDGFYHSDGDMGWDGDYSKKYSAFDCLVPTFGADKDYYCELDYVDMYMFRMDPGHWGEVSTTAMPDKEAIKRVCRAVYKKGGRGIHFAMSMTEPQAAYAAEACLEFLEEVRSGTVTRLDRSSAANYTFQLAPMVFGQGELLLNYYNSTAGGTETGVVNLKLINNI
ncbi:serine hydrolase [Runella limosa]|uniref:serine hydrolase n=1 Tax=Runella limosa TaxID=370978 RepID=UPI000400729D|nr:serine hydrolase [Runella limosa]